MRHRHREIFSPAARRHWHTGTMQRLLLIDDHAIVREGFKRLLDGMPGFEVTGEAATADVALQLARRGIADIAILDISLGGAGSGLGLLPLLAQAAPAMKRVMLSMHDDPALVLRALESGADGYVTKAMAADELPALLLRIAVGEQALSSDLAPAGLRAQAAPDLTQRERETLRGLLADRPPKALAADLGISDKTLYRHRANLMEKLGARTRGDLLRIVRERGLLAGL